ncbi:TetR/AcrR family transcriptional regulator [Brevundimonas sp. GCM10030266]|uniref:TetR/AcrR family transcriptional regulator n=1 Tax=Brevundimonas sp. GCM10030266 TaxID=3273386 RepID=UPI00360DE91C
MAGPDDSASALAGEKKTGARRQGRPREFDRDAALEVAMRLFWRHGYEGVSLAALTRAMGISSPSFYAAFASKSDVFDEALRHYETTIGSVDLAILTAAPNLEAGVRAFLHDAAGRWTSRPHERGCMIWNGALQAGPMCDPIVQRLRDSRNNLRSRLSASLERFVDPQTAAQLSLYISGLLAGLSSQARDGMTGEQIGSVIDLAVNRRRL